MKMIRALLTLIVVLLAVIAIELAPRPRQPLPPPKLTFDPVEAKLDQHITALKVDQVPVKAAIEALRKETGLDIAIDWATLSASSKQKVDEWKVSLDLHDVPAWVAIELILNQEWTGLYLHFNVQRGVVLIGEGELFKQGDMPLAVYDVRDLLSDDYWGVSTPHGQEQQVLDARSKALSEVVTNIANVVNFPFGGGSTNSSIPYGNAWIECYAGRLFVIETSYGHRRIAQSLTYLRSLKEMPRR